MRAALPFAVTLALLAAGACDAPTPAPTSPDETEVSLARGSGENSGRRDRIECDDDDGGIELPGGFCAVVVHDVKRPDGSAAQARHIAVAPNGDVFVGVQSPGGGVLALRDTDGDGRADETVLFGERGHGIAYQEPFLYHAPNDRVVRYRMSPTSLTPVSGPEVIVSGMPSDGNHRTKSIVVTRGGDLFVNLGSFSDACQVVNRQVGSPGVDPCPEMPTRSGIWRYDAHAPGQVHSPANRFVTGTRNMVALALNHANGEIYGVQHGRDNLNVYWPALFSPQDQAELPAEEFFRFGRAGADYGWPYCYYDGRENRRVLAPEYGGDGEIVGRCAATEMPIDFYPAHWAPNALLFHTGRGMPGKYRDAAFIAFHGGFNRPDPFRDEGFNVTVVRFRDGMPSHDAEVFADGFIGAGAVNLPADARHRPTGLAEGPDGSLYITDDRGGRIWRVVHNGGHGRGRGR